MSRYESSSYHKYTCVGAARAIISVVCSLKGPFRLPAKEKKRSSEEKVTFIIAPCRWSVGDVTCRCAVVLCLSHTHTDSHRWSNNKTHRGSYYSVILIIQMGLWILG